MDLGSIAAKLSAFDLETREVALDAALRELTQLPAPRPSALVAHTEKGRGISFMAGQNRWHYTRLDPSTYAAAMAELRS
jgi:transketolase